MSLLMTQIGLGGSGVCCSPLGPKPGTLPSPTTPGRPLPALCGWAHLATPKKAPLPHGGIWSLEGKSEGAQFPSKKVTVRKKTPKSKPLECGTANHLSPQTPPFIQTRVRGPSMACFPRRAEAPVPPAAPHPRRHSVHSVPPMGTQHEVGPLPGGSLCGPLLLGAAGRTVPGPWGSLERLRLA